MLSFSTLVNSFETDFLIDLNELMVDELDITSILASFT